MPGVRLAGVNSGSASVPQAGPAAVGADAHNASSLGGDGDQAVTQRFVPKSGSSASAGAGENLIVDAATGSGQAMSPLRAYAANLQDVINSLDLTPKEVSVEIRLKIAGEAGCILAKAGTAAEMKVALTWEPGAARSIGGSD